MVTLDLNNEFSTIPVTDIPIVYKYQRDENRKVYNMVESYIPKIICHQIFFNEENIKIEEKAHHFICKCQAHHFSMIHMKDQSYRGAAMFWAVEYDNESDINLSNLVHTASSSYHLTLKQTKVFFIYL